MPCPYETIGCYSLRVGRSEQRPYRTVGGGSMCGGDYFFGVRRRMLPASVRT
jgi:hypothetical protein